MHTIKITPNLLSEYQCTSGIFIRLPNRIESKLFCPNWNALTCSKQPRLVDCRIGVVNKLDRRRRRRFIQSAIDLWWNFLCPEFGIVPERNTVIFWRYPDFLVTQCGIGGSKPPCQKAPCIVQSSRYNTSLWRTNRRKDGHTTTSNTALA